ncbi:hypothetical protein TWF696_006403 [Orbilia brochopaga]|uniref:Uncharacterized protein n=1 Tax=Orbilia brochopaga TaxID=3140254 RepID=A0AAV9UZ99_9PEZI
MPLLEPSEVAALGLSPKDIPAHKRQTSSQSGSPSAGRVGRASSSVVTATSSPHTRRGKLNKQLAAVSTSSTSASPPIVASQATTSPLASTSTSASASPTAASRFTFGTAGGSSGSSFEVCIKVPSKRKHAQLQQYQRFPDADSATTTAGGWQMQIAGTDEGTGKRPREDTAVGGEPSAEDLDAAFVEAYLAGSIDARVATAKDGEVEEASASADKHNEPEASGESALAAGEPQL